jgi:hypothetical protein
MYPASDTVTDTGVSVDVPPDEGYNVDFGCKAGSPSTSIRFELLSGTTTIVAGTGPCDGNDYSDTSLLRGHPAEAVHLAVAGDLSQISAAYLILVPTQPS